MVIVGRNVFVNLYVFFIGEVVYLIWNIILVIKKMLYRIGIVFIELFCKNRVRVSMVIMCKKNCLVVFFNIWFGRKIRFFDFL